MSATERMIAYHLLRLKDKNPEVRIKSIQELALLQATEAFPILEELYRSDEDLLVRKAAQEAGKTLFLLRKSKEKNNSNPPGS